MKILMPCMKQSTIHRLSCTDQYVSRMKAAVLRIP